MSSDARRSSSRLRLRAIVADDDPDHRALLTAVLERAGFEVTAVHDGQELLDLLRWTPTRHFRLVVTDQRMPRLMGTEVLAQAASRRARFIVVSAVDSPLAERAAEQFGASAFVRKPIDVDSFLDLVSEVLQEDTQRIHMRVR